MFYLLFNVCKKNDQFVNNNLYAWYAKEIDYMRLIYWYIVLYSLLNE